MSASNLRGSQRKSSRRSQASRNAALKAVAPIDKPGDGASQDGVNANDSTSKEDRNSQALAEVKHEIAINQEELEFKREAQSKRIQAMDKNYPKHHQPKLSKNQKVQQGMQRRNNDTYRKNISDKSAMREITRG